MENIFTNLQRSFLRGGILTKLIYINVGVFLVIHLWRICFILFNLPEITLLPFLQMPSSPGAFITKPWTVITYMFTHFDFLHILFNMLWLYWFGTIFLQFFNPRQLGGLYLLGGIAGGLLFMAAYNLFPYFRNLADQSALMGASASVMAVVFAVSFYRKDYFVTLLFLGRVKLIYLACGVFIFDLLAITSSNAGGHIAHIGGALLGICFASRPKGFTLKRKPKMRVSYHKRNETDYEYNARQQAANAEIDAILDKLKQSGYAGLSSAEKKKLFDASRK
ncbi:MAG: rhomboid family intramembrane serine protease [Tannerellaceae bacterium]|jgi:membrane associated rhomboid family serine protease|nr:rhomboid family intramembrane serine protease [Tannerellaceae bacterium]